MLDGLATTWRDEETKLLQHLRQVRHGQRAQRSDGSTVGARVADKVAEVVGSWRFIIIQSIILVIWMAVNVIGFIQAWDPYPFILLNLVLSFQAAYTAPIIMMSQNRQAEIDRSAAQHDYDVNLKAELEVELLHRKIDLLREQEMTRMLKIIEDLQTELQAVRAK